MMPQGDLLIDDLTLAEFVELKAGWISRSKADINGLLEMVELRESREQMVKSFWWSKEALVLVVNYFESSKIDF